ncbi:MAG: ABC transporter transmembrane domain-containing protein, partial [Clostridia bacterium]|nr:ABC transporter transmembrane domain-containing protein [Clostridia bacterium]
MDRQNNQPSLFRGVGGGPARFAPSAKPRDAKRTMLRIGAMYLQYGKSIFVASAFTAASAGIAVAVPYFIGRSFNAFDVSAMRVDFPALYLLLATLALLYASNWAVTTAGSVLMLKVSQRIVFGLRSAFFDKLQKLPLKFFDTRAHGDTMSRLTNDVDNISVTIAQTTTQLVSSALTLGGSL